LNEHQTEILADQVLTAFGQLTPPVNLQAIAAEESIELVEGDFGDDFQGRIEYLSEVETFAIYHPSFLACRYQPRVRFSISHELGHFYIPEHREMLLRNISHNSLEGFRHQNDIEREADSFASALLVPSAVLRARMGRRGFLSLRQILELADECQASPQATAFRYTRFTEEPYLAIVSEDGAILYSFVSEEAKVIGFGGIGNKRVPDGSATARAAGQVASRIEEGKIQSELWFSDREAHADLWEEAVRLGASTRVLTVLSWEHYDPQNPHAREESRWERCWARSGDGRVL
jgi:hypothetical protein